MPDFFYICRILAYLDQHALAFSTGDGSDHRSELALECDVSMVELGRILGAWLGDDSVEWLVDVWRGCQQAGLFAQLAHTTSNAFPVPPGQHGVHVQPRFVFAEKELSARSTHIFYEVVSTIWGWAFIAYYQQGICRLSFMLDNSVAQVGEQWQWLQKHYPGVDVVHQPHRRQDTIAQIFPGNSRAVVTATPIQLWCRGTVFQRRVWRQLLLLAPGQLTSYGELAQCLGAPTAVRAVATAVGANPIASAIPCHRVIQKNGGLGGYRWGLARKRAMLMRELRFSVR